MVWVGGAGHVILRLAKYEVGIGAVRFVTFPNAKRGRPVSGDYEVER